MSAAADVAAAQAARHKQFLRGLYGRKLADLSKAALRRGARKAADLLTGLPQFANAQTVGLYVPVGRELDVRPIFDLCAKTGKLVAVPVVDPRRTEMSFSLLGDSVSWKPNVYGIPEPIPGHQRVIDGGNLDLLLVPGRAFTAEGRRLGVGAGYYDRFLAVFPRVSAVGVCHDCQIAPRLPFLPHDALMDAVVTPTHVYLP